MEFKFPKGFYWGSATSAHQVEGENHNDWSEWESSPARIENLRLKFRTPAFRKQFPDYILRKWPSPLDLENYISGRACDHYHRFKEDFDIAKSLGHNAHRFSIEWSRIEPEEGKFNEKEIEHYREVIQALRERGMEPFVTLWHWTNPLWFASRIGWHRKESISYFERYAEKIVSALPAVRFWITMNETNVYTGMGYLAGLLPPRRISPVKYLKANHHLSQAHQRVYAEIKSLSSEAQVGVTHNLIYFSKFPARIKKAIWNNFFISSLGTFQDFIGVNYYTSDRNTKERSEYRKWPIDPEGFYFVLKEASRHQKPIYIFENGIADARDIKRSRFIKEHIVSMARAMTEGADVRGYFYWSLLDNFEWDKGFWPRFGLVEVDYKTMKREVRPSAYEYRKIMKRAA